MTAFFITIGHKQSQDSDVRYAPELQLVGVAAGAPPTDLVQNLSPGSDPSIRAFLTAFTAYSCRCAFGDFGQQVDPVHGGRGRARLSWLEKKFHFDGVRLVTISEGEIDTIKFAIASMLGSRFLNNLRMAVRTASTT